MESKSTQNEEFDEQDNQGDATPVCLNCFQPINPLDDYCPNCGGMVGNFTPYIPVRNIRWFADIFGKAWRQIWSHDISIKGRLLRLIMIILGILILLKII